MTTPTRHDCLKVSDTSDSGSVGCNIMVKSTVQGDQYRTQTPVRIFLTLVTCATVHRTIDHRQMMVAQVLF